MGPNHGTTDLSNDVDILHAVGEENEDIFGEWGREKWNLRDIFEHIVQERILIDFTLAPKKSMKKDIDVTSKLSGMFKKKEKQENNFGQNGRDHL